jgi:hypothetical protein
MSQLGASGYAFEHIMTNKYPECYEPYLLWALKTNFKMLDTGILASLFVEFAHALTEKDVVEAIDDLRIIVRGTRSDIKTKFHTLSCPHDFLKDLDKTKIWEKAKVRRLDLCAPIRPKVWSGLEEKQVRVKRPSAKSSVLIGLIDDGFPVFHWRYREGDTSRVLAHWDMDGVPVVFKDQANGKKYQLGLPVTDLSYGSEMWRDYKTNSGGIGMEDWRKLFVDADSSLNEDDCYAFARMTSMRLAGTHGSHIMDLAAGKVPLSSKLCEPDTAPSFKELGAQDDPASASDLVCVQIMKSQLNDSSGRWLGASVFDGLRYILSFASSDTKKVLINLSYGPITGPHDGSSMLEQAMDELISIYDGQNGKPQLEVFLPAGNYYQSQAHAVLEPGESVTLFLPPGSRWPSFVEVWAESPPKVKVVSPSLNEVAHSIFCKGTGCLLAFAPTSLEVTDPAESGKWTIKNESAFPFQLYIGRNDFNFGSKLRAQPAKFIDDNYDNEHYLRPELDTLGSVPSPIQRDNTISGIATGGRTKVTAGYVMKSKRPSKYSSASSQNRIALQLPTDENMALLGLRASGTRAGSSLRLIGTSTASPLALRRGAAGILPGRGSGDVSSSAPKRGIIIGKP